MTRCSNRFLRLLAVAALGCAGLAAPSLAQSSRPVTTAATAASPASTTSPYDDVAIGETAAARPGAAADPAAPPATPPNSIGFDLGRMGVALVIVLALIFGARWLFAHLFAGARAPATSRAVKVLGRTSLAPRQQVLLLQVGRRVVVVGESNGNLSTLANLDDADEVAALIGQLQEEQIARGASFGGLFGRSQKRYADDEHAPRALADMDDAPAEPGRQNPGEDPSDDPDATRMKSELSGLVEKMRSIRNRLGS